MIVIILKKDNRLEYDNSRNLCVLLATAKIIAKNIPKPIKEGIESLIDRE